MNILWATPSAAGPRPLIIVLGLHNLGIVARGSWHFEYANLSLGMIGGFTFPSWGTLGRFWDTGEHNKWNFAVKAQIFTDCFWIFVPMGVIWHDWCFYFGVPGDLGTILGRSWHIGEYKEGHCKVQAWISIIFD